MAASHWEHLSSDSVGLDAVVVGCIWHVCLRLRRSGIGLVRRALWRAVPVVVDCAVGSHRRGLGRYADADTFRRGIERFATQVMPKI